MELGLPVFILDMAVEDVDGDGFGDLLALTGNLRTISVFRGRNGRHFGPEERYLVGPGWTSFELSDFDEDGDLDLAIVNPNVKAITIIPNISSGE